MLTFMHQLIIMAVIAMLPLGEGRLSILIGVLDEVEFMGFSIPGFGLDPYFVFFFTLFFNVIGILLAYVFFQHAMKYILKIKFLDKIHYNYTHKKYKKVKPYVDKYGPFGLMIFVAIPLPGSGVWTVALLANFFEFDFKRYFYISFSGIIIALLITLYTTMGFNLLVS